MTLIKFEKNHRQKATATKDDELCEAATDAKGFATSEDFNHAGQPSKLSVKNGC